MSLLPVWTFFFCSGFQVLDSRFCQRNLGFRIPIASAIPDSLSCSPDSKAQDSGIRIPLREAKHMSQSSFSCTTFWGNQRQYQTTSAPLIAALLPRMVAATGTCFPVCHRFLSLNWSVLCLARPASKTRIWPCWAIKEASLYQTVSMKYGQCNSLSLLHSWPCKWCFPFSRPRQWCV